MAEQDTREKDGKTIVETIEVAGGQLIDKVKELIHAGNVRRLRLWIEGGDFTLELPVTAGVIAGGALALTAPWLAVLGVIAALVTKVRIEVEMEEDTATPAAADAEPQPTAVPEQAPAL